jgi:hypothetical protein
MRARGLIAVAVVIGAPALWAFADLMLHHDLPGAAALQHLAFRGLVRPLEWLTENPGHRMRVAVGLWAFVMLSALLGDEGAAPKKWALGATGAAALGGEVVTVALAALMERGLAVGIVLGVLVWAYQRRGSWRAAHRPSWLILGFAGATGLGSMYYVYVLFMTYGQGYPLLQRLGDALRAEGTSFFAAWAVVVSLSGVAAAVLVVRDRGVGTAAREVLPGAAVAAAVGASSSLSAAVVVGPAAVVLVAALGPGLAGVRGPLRWPVLGAIPCVVAGLLFGHTYSARILACPDPDDVRVRVLATPGEIFRIAQGADGVLSLSMRADRRFGRLDATGQFDYAAAGPLADGGGSNVAGTPEELVYAPSRDVFFASVAPHQPEAFASGPVVPKNLLVTISGDGSRVLDAFGIEGLCWINTLHWNDPEDLLYIGCEDRPGLYRWNPDEGMKDSITDPRLGDVQDLAFGDGGSIFTISLWFSRYLTELSAKDLSIVRRTPIGGTHYHLAYDAPKGLLFASSYYGGRVRIIDAATLERRGTLSGGFGTREVAVDSTRSLLLASGTYDGLIHVWGTESLPLAFALEPIRVGGHIKDITIDEATGKAWTWSQCGLLEIDLEALR